MVASLMLRGLPALIIYNAPECNVADSTTTRTGQTYRQELVVHNEELAPAYQQVHLFLEAL